MRRTLNRILQLVLVLSLLLFLTSKAYALPPGLYFLQCTPGQRAAVYNLVGDSVMELGWCEFGWTIKFYWSGSHIIWGRVQQDNGDQPQSGTKFLYLPYNANIVQVQMTPSLSISPSGKSNTSWKQRLGTVDTAITIINIESLKANVETAQFPAVYSARAENVSMEYKRDARGGYQLWLNVVDDRTVRRLLIPASEPEASQKRLDNHLSEFLADQRGFLETRLVRECDGNTNNQKDTLKIVLPLFLRPSSQLQPQQPIVSNSQPPPIDKVAPAGWRIEVEEGRTARATLTINNRCSAPHYFRITSKAKGLRFEQQTDKVLIGASSSKVIGALFDTKGLKSNVYKGKVVIECIDCKKEPNCTQDRDELPVEMTIIKRRLARTSNVSLAKKPGQ